MHWLFDAFIGCMWTSFFCSPTAFVLKWEMLFDRFVDYRKNELKSGLEVFSTARGSVGMELCWTVFEKTLYFVITGTNWDKWVYRNRMLNFSDLRIVHLWRRHPIWFHAQLLLPSYILMRVVDEGNFRCVRHLLSFNNILMLLVFDFFCGKIYYMFEAYAKYADLCIALLVASAFIYAKIMGRITID